MDLASWQARLQSHFSRLREERSIEHDDAPVFALEHGLDRDERSRMLAAVASSLRDGGLSNDVDLPWIVYATELGYAYAGSEYWQTFATRTPNWKARGDRQWIRQRFRVFAQGYGGFVPEGPWAQHFSIICWPITHAILPLDLQIRVAQILYGLRHNFTEELLSSARDLGQMIASRGWEDSSRLRLLAGEPELIGRVALGLLHHGHRSNVPLLESTLKRIALDLGERRQAREWLHDARTVAQRVRLRGLAQGRPSQPSEVPQDLLPARDELIKLGLEPSLALRLDGQQRWNVWLELPNMSPLLARFPGLRHVLKNERCKVAGASGSPLARERLLRARQHTQLTSWPRPGEVLLQFDTNPQTLQTLLSAECMLRPGPRWVFRVASDGIAYELRGRVVRPSKRYVVIEEIGHESADENALLEPVEINCAGVAAYLLQMPDSTTSAQRKELAEMGMATARSVDVWPAGLAAAIWDGEGYAEWLAGEAPTLAIQIDHEIQHLDVRLSTLPNSPLRILSPEPGRPVFVQFPALHLGAHVATVSATDHIGQALEQGHVEIVIRDRRPWVPGASLDGDLVVVADPPSPSLDQLWRGAVAIDAYGAVGEDVLCTISFYEAGRDEPLFTQKLPTMQLPIRRTTWMAAFRKSVRQNEASQNAYDIADTATISFVTARSSGFFRVRCEREVTPFRWVTRYRNQDYAAALVDDRGTGDPLQVQRYTLAAPALAEACDPTTLETPRRVEPGLWVASDGTVERAVLIAPRVIPLHEVKPAIRSSDAATSNTARWVKLCLLWGNARLVGSDLARLLRVRVLDGLIREVYRVLGGPRWGDAEDSLQDTEQGGRLRALQEAVPADSTRRPEVQLASELSGQCAREFARATTERRVELFAALASKHIGLRATRLSNDDRPLWITEFALRLASAPESLEAWSPGKVQSGLQQLAHQNVLARAARFLVLAVEFHQSGLALGVDTVYEAWQWN